MAGSEAAQLMRIGGAGTGVMVGKARLGTTDEILNHLQSFSGEKGRYLVQQEVLGALMGAHDEVGGMIEGVLGYMEKDKAYTVYKSKREFEEEWVEAKVVVQELQKKRNRVKEAIKAAMGNWTEETVRWLHEGKTSHSYAANVRVLSGKYTEAQAALRVNAAVVARLQKTQRGISTKKWIQSADLIAATKIERAKPLTMDEMRAHGLQIGPYGFVEEGGTLSMVEQRGESSGGETNFLSPAQEMSTEVSDRESEVDDEYFDPDVGDDTIDRRMYQELAEELDEDDEEEKDEETARSAKRRKTKETKCGCSSDVDQVWQATIMKNRPYSMDFNLKLLKRMQGYRHVCYVHAKAVGGHMGLRVKQLKEGSLKERLALLHERRLEIGDIKVNSSTFSWFRMKNRPSRASDALGPYKFMHKQTPESFEFDEAEVLRKARISSGQMDTWIEEGSVNLDTFKWWFECGIGEIVLAEFDMYRHHLREINGKDNYGWLRSMLYSIGQQLMRQDPLYYATYTALRPDKQWRLVTYPYYAKYAVEGDKTYFRHIDLNIPELLKNSRGANMIQGSVSLDDEDETNCTVILPGMQHKMSEWWDRVVERKQETDGFVHRITDRMFTKKDAEELGVDWKKVPCSRGQARITIPQLPHGADGPSTGTRRTMLPWFVGLQGDLATLEVVEGGTWEMLSKAHRDMTAPEFTPSGLANRYGAIPYRFPAAVEVAGLGALSDALVCRRKWDSLAVLKDRDTLLLGNTRAFEKYIDEWRKKAVVVAEEAFALVREQEMAVFGEKSYFRLCEQHHVTGLQLPEMEPDEGEGEESDEERAGEEDFAEKPR
jgi:hypothetical protein